MARYDYDVFLSHNSADKPAVEELAKWLVRAGLTPFFDEWDLVPGEPSQAALERALSRSASCAVVLGPGGRGPWNEQEMRAAIAMRVGGQDNYRIIPVLLPGAARTDVPPFLATYAWVEFAGTLDDEKARHRLYCGVLGKEPGPIDSVAVAPGESPYRGLQVFDVERRGSSGAAPGPHSGDTWMMRSLSGRSPRPERRAHGDGGAAGADLTRAGYLCTLQEWVNHNRTPNDRRMVG